MKKSILIAMGLASIALVGCTEKSTTLSFQNNIDNTATDAFVSNQTPKGVTLSPNDNATEGELTITGAGACNVYYVADTTGVQVLAANPYTDLTSYVTAVEVDVGVAIVGWTVNTPVTATYTVAGSTYTASGTVIATV